MIKEAINRIVELAEQAKEKPIDVGGRTYWKNTHEAIRPPRVSPVADVYSLGALLSALDAPELAGHAEDGAQIVVESPREVSVGNAADCTWAQRDEFVKATCRSDEFPFNRYMLVEDFVIKAQCLFVDSDTKAALIAHVSSIVGEETITLSDDGISQETVVENRVSNRKERTTFTPILELRPYRTFPEVEQPLSRFLLRISKDGDSPTAALFEADGGLWKAQACENVARCLRADERVQELGIKVIG